MLTGLNCVGTGKGVTVEFSMNGRNMTKGIKENQKLLKIIEKHRQAEVDSFLCLLLRLHFSSVYISWKAKK